MISDQIALYSVQLPLLLCNELIPGHPTFFFQSQDQYRTEESEFLQIPVRFDPHLWLVWNERSPILLFWTRPLIGRKTLSGPGWVRYTVTVKQLDYEPEISIYARVNYRAIEFETE